MTDTVDKATGNKLKGGVMKSYYKFIARQWGGAGVRECEEATGVYDSELKEEVFYPWEFNEKILLWISEKGGSDQLRKLGNFIVKNLGVLSYLVRFANMKFFLRKAKENYDDTFNYGRVSVLMDERGKMATVIFKDTNKIEESCQVWLGLFEGMLEMTKSKGTVTKAKCQVTGDDYCEYIIKWE